MSKQERKGIFSDNAPRYWAAGLPAMPLMPKQKRPAVSGWQLLANRQPTQAEKDAWLQAYPEGNIGLAMGAASGLVAIDMDTDDPKVLEILDRILPPSPWRRVGSKGFVKIFKYNGERTARIQSSEGMICEILSTGTQIVLPPSIHPDTQRPYTANANLYDVVKNVPKLIIGVEDMIREALMEAGYDVGKSNSNKTMDFVPAGQRDNKAIWHAGLLARAVLRGERTLEQALGEMELWVEEKVEQVVGDPISVDKAKKKLIEFVHRDIHGARKMALPSGWDDGLEEEDKEKLGLKIDAEDEKWTASRILQQVADDLQQWPDLQSEGFHAAMHANIARLARSEGEINSIDEGRILKMITSSAAGQINMSDLRKQLKMLRMGDIEGENHDEIAGAVHEHINQFGEVRYHASQFWQWKGSHWEEKPEHEILNVISGEFGFYPSCRKTSDYHGILKLMKSKCSKELQQVEMRGVNFANGFLDDQLKLQPHNPDFGCTCVLSYCYHPEEAENTPMFSKFLFESWGHDLDFSEKVAAFQEAVGATLFQVSTKYQKAFCLVGVGGSGKSVASQVVMGLLPKGSISNVPPEKWHDTFLPAQMHGKVMNFAGELSETKQISGELFKQIVVGEAITAQHKNQQPFVFSPTAAQWFASNYSPRTRDVSGGFNRRWLFIEWNRVVPAEIRNIDLADQIISGERQAIAAWAIEGYRRLKANGHYTEPSSHRLILKKMAAANNSVMAFLEQSDNLVVGKNAVAQAKMQDATLPQLYDEFRTFSFRMPGRSLDTVSFMQGLAALQQEYDFTVEPGQGRSPEVVRGIAVIA